MMMSSYRPQTTSLVIVAALACVAAACSPDFEPYNEVHNLRVLAVRAEPPQLPPDESATLDLLVHVEPDDPRPVTYHWSWCPFSAGSTSGYTCATDRDTLQALIDEAAPGVVEVPGFDLGTSATATLPYPVPPVVLQAACQQLLMQDVPDFLELPDCVTGFPVLIKVEVRQGDDVITAVKEVKLLYGANEAPNANPALSGASIFESKAGPSTSVVLGEEPVALRRGLLHRWHVELEAGEAELFQPSPRPEDPDPAPAHESLAVSWFAQGGEMEYRRTGYIEDFTTFEQATANAWTTPTTKEFDGESMSIYMVVRDNRGGVGWLSRQVTFR